MKKILYTVGEIAEILGLHPKTVQRFIREGKLKAKKIGRAWKIHADDFKEYSHAELAVPATSADRNIEDRVPAADRVSVSAVIELKEAKQEEASRISNTLIAILNGKDPSWGQARYDFIFQPETGSARFVLYGTPKFISSIMNMLEPLLSTQEK